MKSRRRSSVNGAVTRFSNPSQTAQPLSATRSSMDSPISRFENPMPASVAGAFGPVLGVGFEEAANVTPLAPGFSGALVWQVQTPAAVVCVHRHPAERMSLERCEEIAAVAQAWNDAGLPIARWLRTGQGRAGVVCGAHVWTVEQWLPGTANYWAAPTHDKLENACRVLARVHAVSEQWSSAHAVPAGWYARSAPPRRLGRRIELWHEYVAGWSEMRLDRRFQGDLIGRLFAEWSELAPRLAERVLPTANRLAEQATRQLAALRDVWHDHVLFTGDAVTGLVDPGACGVDSPMADLSRLLGSLVGDDSSLWLRGMAAYGEVRPLSNAEQALLDVYDATSVLLSGTAWRAKMSDHAGGVCGGLADADLARVEARWSRLLERLKGRLAGFRVAR